MEKTWFLNQCWILGEEMDDDVMDQQKYAVSTFRADASHSTPDQISDTPLQSAAMVLAKALVDAEQDMDKTFDDHHGHILPEVPLHEARQIMTRADFIKSYDAINIFTIDSLANVRADSVPMMNAFREICAEPGFAEHLEATLDRISAIESLGRTRELTIKDLWGKGKYRFEVEDGKGRVERRVFMNTERDEDDGGDEEKS